MIDMGAGQVCTALSPPSPPLPLSPSLSPPLPPLPPSSPPSPPLSPGANATAAFPLDVVPESAGCPPVGPCLGFEGSCGDLQEQFATLAGCYYYGDPGAEEYHEFLADYVCHAFPDDAYVTDQFFVGLSACAACSPRVLCLLTHPCVRRAQSASLSRCPWTSVWAVSLRCAWLLFRTQPLLRLQRHA